MKMVMAAAMTCSCGLGRVHARSGKKLVHFDRKFRRSSKSSKLAEQAICNAHEKVTLDVLGKAPPSRCPRLSNFQSSAVAGKLAFEC